MTRDQWQRVKHVAAAALDLPDAARRAYVVDACGGDEAFEREVVSLLSSAVSAENLFEMPISLTPAAVAALDGRPGQRPSASASGRAFRSIMVRSPQWRPTMSDSRVAVYRGTC